MKNYILGSIFFCLCVTPAAYGQDRPPTESSNREGERTSCIQSPGAMKDYIEKESDRINKENPR